jgi:hypothetical protein
LENTYSSCPFAKEKKKINVLMNTNRSMK